MTIEFFEERNVGTRSLPRSLATRAGGFVFVSGQVARDENGVIAEGIEAQTRQTMKNVAYALAAAGCGSGAVGVDSVSMSKSIPLCFSAVNCATNVPTSRCAS